MTALPSLAVLLTDLNEGEITEALWAPIVAVLAELPGGAAATTLALTSNTAGAIEPTGAVHLVDTAGGAASGNLDTILATNHTPGRLLILAAASDARAVVVRHARGGAGQVFTADGQSFLLTTTQRLRLMRAGEAWVEVGRDYGGGAAWRSGILAPWHGVGARSASWTVTTAELGRLILVDAGAGAVTATLPAAAAAGAGTTVSIKRTDASTNALQVAPAGGETIDGGGALPIAEQQRSVTLVSDGAAAWHVVAGADRARQVLTRSSSFTIAAADADATFLVTVGGASITATLPAAAAIGAGRGVTIKRVSAAAGVLTVARAGSDTIDGVTSRTLILPHQGLQLVSDGGTGWRVVAEAPALGGPAHLGELRAFAGAEAPAGWLLCHGQAVSRTTYSALFAAIGTTFGAGNGTSTFNLPDLRGRVIAGRDNMGGTAAGRLTSADTGHPGIDGTALGAAGGADRHTLTTPQMPAHTHQIRGGSSGNAGVGTTNSGDNQTRTSESTGGGQAHPNVQPTIILNQIIYAGV